MPSNPHVLRGRLLGLLFLVIISLLLGLTVAVYRGDLSSAVPVLLRTDNIGNQLMTESDVKVRGLVVGSVKRISSRGAGAELELAMQPDKLALIPRDVSARLLPKTLFGERYVALVLPAEANGQTIGEGDVIEQDRSATAVELERLLANLMPMLEAVQPHKLSVTLGAMSAALANRGKALGQNLVRLDHYLREINPEVPALTEGMRELVKVADTYSTAIPDALDALTDLTVTTRTFVEQRENLKLLYRSLGATANDLGGFLRANKDNVIRLTDASRATLETMAKYSPAWPCMADTLTRFKPIMNAAFGAGTDRPGLKVNLHPVPARGEYKAGKDDPVYRDRGGPRCYPFGTPPSGGKTVALPVTGDTADLGLANSPQESQFLAQLLAPALGRAADQVPSWSGVLLGAIYRGTEVTLQ
ncbi:MULTISPECIES: MCE family protein [unclassified Crossiella]|uniref:MCE family protein n=1 Tax=unclassified Crossiella TaxID=2620835 RepID=UPI0020003402|nr:MULTISPECIES: MCE family protein [unclassified Crossiella]MCK2239909.1 MCE family protein [Crossiella sp. S99.2]MCK2252617.1 MCE family protein [Crossiella sp. S99.1]